MKRFDVTVQPQGQDTIILLHDENGNEFGYIELTAVPVGVRLTAYNGLPERERLIGQLIIRP